MGLNHLAWITKVEYQGKDYLEEAIKEGINSGNMKNIPTLGFSKELIATCGAIPTSYLNYYYINGAILVPQFGGANKESDKRALDILKDIHPDREVIGIPATDILLGGGNIHCITQQIPE